MGGDKLFNDWLVCVAGLIWAEIKQLWDEGALEYIYDMWNILDFTTNSLYIATFTLRLLAYLTVTPVGCCSLFRTCGDCIALWSEVDSIFPQDPSLLYHQHFITAVSVSASGFKAKFGDVRFLHLK